MTRNDAVDPPAVGLAIAPVNIELQARGLTMVISVSPCKPAAVTVQVGEKVFLSTEQRAMATFLLEKR